MGTLNKHKLDEYIRDYGCNIMIETGTGKGEGVTYALGFPFEKIHSIEIIEKLFNETSKNIVDPRINFLNCESPVGLESLFKNEVKETDVVLFFLDAHFPGADFQIDGHHYDEDLPKRLKFPLNLELEMIKKYRKGKDVMIIDDLNHHEDGPFETGNLIARYRYFRPKYGLNGTNYIVEMFKETHDVTKDYRDQGYLIITPKEKVK